jgi:hypothetical protein
MLEAMVPEVYAMMRRERMAKARPQLAAEPPEACPWTFDQLLDGRFWPPEAPPRQP